MKNIYSIHLPEKPYIFPDTINERKVFYLDLMRLCAIIKVMMYEALLKCHTDYPERKLFM